MAHPPHPDSTADRPGQYRNPVLDEDWPEHWIGTEVGLFATAPPGTGPAPSARYGAFQMTSTQPAPGEA